MRPDQHIIRAHQLKGTAATLLLLAALFLPAHLPAAATQSAPTSRPANWLDSRVTIQSEDEQLHILLKQIADQSGIVIYYDEQLAHEVVKGNYTNIKAMAAIKRLFSDKNKIILIDDKEKAIIVKTFGMKNLIRVDGGAQPDTSIPMPLAELDVLQDLQAKQMQEDMTNPGLLLQNGLTLGELQALQTEQESEFQNQLRDDLQLVKTGVNLGELKAKQAEQEQEFQKRVAEDPQIPDSSITLSSLQTLHESQNIEFQENVSKNAARIKVSTIPLAELQAMHEQQQQDFENTLQDRSRIIR